VRFAGSELRLPHVISGSGARYSDGKTTFWNKGRSVLVEVDDRVIVQDCNCNDSHRVNAFHRAKWRSKSALDRELPTKESVAKLYDDRDFQQATQAYRN